MDPRKDVEVSKEVKSEEEKVKSEDERSKQVKSNGEILKEVKKSVRKIITTGSAVYQRPLLSYLTIIGDDKKVGMTRQNYLGKARQVANAIDVAAFDKKIPPLTKKQGQLLEDGLMIMYAAHSILSSRSGNCTEYSFLSLYKLFIEGMQGTAEALSVGRDHMVLILNKNPEVMKDKGNLYKFDEWSKGDTPCVILDTWRNIMILPTQIPETYFPKNFFNSIVGNSWEIGIKDLYSFETLKVVKEILTAQTAEIIGLRTTTAEGKSIPKDFDWFAQTFRENEARLFQELELKSVSNQKSSNSTFSFFSKLDSNQNKQPQIVSSTVKQDDTNSFTKK